MTIMTTMTITTTDKEASGMPMIGRKTSGCTIGSRRRLLLLLLLLYPVVDVVVVVVVINVIVIVNAVFFRNKEIMTMTTMKQ